MEMMWIVAAFASVIAVVIMVLGFIMVSPEGMEKMSVFEDTANEAARTGKSTVNDISKLNASSVMDPIVEKKDEVIAIITNNSNDNNVSRKSD